MEEYIKVNILKKKNKDMVIFYWPDGRIYEGELREGK